MSVGINDRGGTAKLLHNLEKSSRENADSLEKLSSGQVFTAEDPRPADRSIAAGLEFKLRSLGASKQNINEGISLVQTAEGGFSEISNMLVRMKEVNVAAASTTLSDRERKYLFIEYQALHNEIDRVAASTEYNGIPLLNGSDERTPERLILRLGDPMPDGNGVNLNEIRLENLRSVDASADALGLRSATQLLTQDGEIEASDAIDMLQPDDSSFSTTYDQALDKVSGYRAQYGAMQTRLNVARDYNDVAFENIAAAKSRISDTDYAKEVSRLTQTSLLMQTTTALLTQNNLASRLGANMVNALLN